MAVCSLFKAKFLDGTILIGRKSSQPKSVNAETLQLSEGGLRKSSSVHAIADSWRYRMSHYRSETTPEANSAMTTTATKQRSTLDNLKGKLISVL